MRNLSTGRRTALLAAATALLLVGCASNPRYSSVGEPNLKVSAKASGGFLESASTFGHVYALGADCKRTYLGEFKIDSSGANVGLANGQQALLMLEFNFGGFFSSGTRTVSHGFVFTPRSGSRYEADMSYKDALYSVTLTEVRGGTRRELPSTRTSDPCAGKRG